MNKVINKHLLIVGSTGLLGFEFTKQILNDFKFREITTVSKNKHKDLFILNKEKHIFGDFSKPIYWENVLKKKPDIILLISNCRHFFALEKAINKVGLKKKDIELILIGTTGVYSPVKNYSEIYNIIERRVEFMKFKKHVILRPTLIYGSSRDQNVNKVIKFIKKYKFFLSLSGDLGSIQPVYYKDIIIAMINSVYKEDISGIFNITGKDCLDYNDFYSIIFKSLKIKRRLIKVPFKLSMFISYILEYFFGKQFIINNERIRRLKEKKCFSNKAAIDKKLYIPTGFSDGISFQINDLEK